MRLLDHALYLVLPTGEDDHGFVIANELGVNISRLQGPVIEKAGDLVAILNDLEPGDVLLSMKYTVWPMAVEEVPLQCYGRFYIDIMIGLGMLIVVSILIYHRLPS